MKKVYVAPVKIQSDRTPACHQQICGLCAVCGSQVKWQR